jgi:hypothetical protein
MPEVGNLEWLETVIKNPDAGPAKRSGHSVTIIGLPNNPTLIVIGGFTEEGHTNDVWQLKLGAENVEWVLPKIGQPQYAPSPRWRHSANLLPNGKGIFVFGGMGSKQRFDDCYLLSTTSTFRWSIPKVTGSIPEPRANHSMTQVGDKFFLFGGYGGKGYTRAMFNDLYSLDTVAMEWSKITASGKLPDPRSNHACISIREQLFVLGGRIYAVGGKSDHNRRTASVERYCPSSNSWSAVAGMGVARDGFATHGMRVEENLFDSLVATQRQRR